MWLQGVRYAAQASGAAGQAYVSNSRFIGLPVGAASSTAWSAFTRSLLLATAGGASVLLATNAEADTAEARGKSPHVLYQYEVCPWCNKVKAVLDYHAIPYRTVEVHPLFKSELKWSEYKKVPIVVLPDGTQINDSTVIVDYFSEHAGDAAAPGASRRGWLPWSKKAPAAAASAPVSDEESRWRTWADKELVQIVTTNLYSTLNESFRAMDYIQHVESFDSASKAIGYYSGAMVMYMIGRGLPKKYGLEDVDLKEELVARVNSFVDAVGSRRFLGGKKPNRADLAVFGIIRAVSGTGTFETIITESKILPWWQRMVEVVGESSRVEELIPAL